jgi:hypothetical protein
MGEFDKIAERAIAWIDAVVIRYVIAIIAQWRRLERHQPDGGDTQPVQVVQPPHQALEVTDAVAVGIHVASNRQAIDDRVLVPQIVDHGLPCPTVRD